MHFFKDGNTSIVDISVLPPNSTVGEIVKLKSGRKKRQVKSINGELQFTLFFV